jgi:hypothetical protein
MRALVLHIGHSKCASSSLQAFLSANLCEPIADGNGGAYRYVAISGNGSLLSGNQLKSAAQNSHSKYVATELNIRDQEKFKIGLNNIKKFCGPNDTIVLSNEGWGTQEYVNEQIVETLNEFGFPVHVFLLTRPPVDWFNASWWQWGCWTGQSIESWFKEYQNINFMESLRQLKEIKAVKLARVADISQDPISSFLDFLGINPKNFESTNNGNLATDADLLKHIIRNRDHYKRSTHNAKSEFVLNSILRLERKKLPQVANQGMARVIIHNNLVDHQAILDEMAWCKVPLSNEVAEKYISESSYDQFDKFDFENFTNSDYSDEFIFKLIDRAIDLHSTLSEISSFDPQKYLEMNQDVKKSGINPFQHFIEFGLNEGRKFKEDDANKK